MTAALALLGLLGLLAAMMRPPRRAALPGPAERPDLPDEDLPRHARDATRTSLADATDVVYALITGCAGGAATLRAPITGRPCLAYELYVVGPLGCVHHEVRATGLELHDRHGRAVVDTADATIRLGDADVELVLGQRRSGRKVLAALDVPSGRYVGYEAILRPGDPLIALGRVIAPSSSDGSPYRGGGPGRIGPDPAHGLILTARADDFEVLGVTVAP